MAAPTVSLYVPTVSATRMAPCPVSARLDVGAVEKSIRNGTYTWATVNSGTTDTFQVNNDNLDGDETADDTTAQSFTDTIVDVVANASSSTRTNAIWIFPSVSIASGKAIVSAKIQVYAVSTGGIIGTLYGEDVDSAADLATTADINGRTLTTANVAWNSGAQVGNTWTDSPDITDIIQEIYDRNGSITSANLAIIAYGSSGSSSVGRSNGYTNPDGTEFAAKLVIEYADAPLSNEYKLGTTLANLTDSGGTPSNIIVRENGSIMPEGTVGSLASGEWGQSGGELYVRLSDDADPETKATDYIDITYDVTLSGQGGSSNIGSTGIGWTLDAGSEYTLDTELPEAVAAMPTRSRIRIKEGSGLSGAHLARGFAGSLSAGEWDIIGETLYIRLSDSSNPESAAAADIVLEYEVWPAALLVEWEVNSSGSGVANWGSRYRYSTDPRSETSSQQIDHAGKATSGNKPNGLGYMWIFDVADTYTISATVTNTDGDSTTETVSGIVIAADSRTEYNVAASGGDDTSLASLIGTIGESTDDIKIIIEDGHTENFTAGHNLTGDNWWITTETDSGTKPVLTYSDATDTGGVDYFNVGGENCVWERVALAESTGNTGDGSGATIAIKGWDFTSTNSACVECEVHGNDLTPGAGGFRLFNAFTAGNAVGVLLLNCSTEYTDSYSLVGPDSGTSNGELVCSFGGSYGASETESIVRTLPGSSFWNVGWNDLTGDQTKSALRFAGGAYHNAYANNGLDGDMWTGAPNAGAASELVVHNVRINSNKMGGTISASTLVAGIREAVEVIVSDNNYAYSATNAPMTLGNNSDGTYPRKAYLFFSHNTHEGLDTWDGNFMRGGTTGGQADHSRNRVSNNLFVHEDAADMTDRFIDIGTAISRFDGNVWPATQTNLIEFGRGYVGTTTAGANNYANLAAWNAASYVGTDTETDVTLDADIVPDSPTTVTTEPGVHYDYYGNARGANSYAGAVIAANPSSGGGSSRNLLLLGVG